MGIHVLRLLAKVKKLRLRKTDHTDYMIMSLVGLYRPKA